jgi:hypothetical protein
VVDARRAREFRGPQVPEGDDEVVANETVKTTSTRKTRVATNVTSLDTLVGAHPHALAGIFAKGEPASPDALGPRPHGRLLALTATREVHLAFRPIVEWISTSIMPWDGLVFDHGGNAGKNLVFGRETMRFRSEVGPSELDGEPALVLSYAANSWPIRLLRDELRTVNDTIAIGPTFVEIGRRPVLVAWFGLETTH